MLAQTLVILTLPETHCLRSTHGDALLYFPWLRWEWAGKHRMPGQRLPEEAGCGQTNSIANSLRPCKYESRHLVPVPKSICAVPEEFQQKNKAPWHAHTYNVRADELKSCKIPSTLEIMGKIENQSCCFCLACRCLRSTIDLASCAGKIYVCTVHTAMHCYGSGCPKKLNVDRANP